MIAIVSALPQEQAALLAQLTHAHSTVHAGRTFWQGQLHGHPVVMVLSGMGKVAAATTATALATHWGVRRMLLTGVAGGLGDGVQVGDVVVAHDYLQHDMDVRPLVARWQVPGYASVRLPCDAALTTLLLHAAHSAMGPAMNPYGGRVHAGLMVSGDQFIGSAAICTQLRGDLHAGGHPALAVEMEGAAIAQVCADYGIAFAAVRTISDRADDDAHTDFLAFVDTVASPLAQRVVQCWLQLVAPA